KFQMSGTWVYRRGTIFLPLQFVFAGMDGSHVIHASMGNLTGAMGFPNGPIPGAGGVTATGSAPATLRVPAHRFVEDAMALIPLPAISQTISTSFGVDAPYVAARLAPGGGPGSFTWCPRDPACVAGGGMRSTDPPRGAGSRNGRVIYRAGANRFGGAMQLGLRRGGTNSVVFHRSPFQVAHIAWGGAGPTLRSLFLGGLGSADAPLMRTEILGGGFATQPTMVPPPFVPIRYPGPKVTTMFGTTLEGSGPVYYFRAP